MTSTWKSASSFLQNQTALHLFFGAAKLSGAGDTDSSALRMMVYGHTLPEKSAADLVVIRTVKVDDKVSLISYSYPFQCGEVCKFLSLFSYKYPF